MAFEDNKKEGFYCKDGRIPNSKGWKYNQTNRRKKNLLSEGHIKEAIKKGYA